MWVVGTFLVYQDHHIKFSLENHIHARVMSVFKAHISAVRCGDVGWFSNVKCRQTKYLSFDVYVRQSSNEHTPGKLIRANKIAYLLAVNCKTVEIYPWTVYFVRTQRWERGGRDQA